MMAQRKDMMRIIRQDAGFSAKLGFGGSVGASDQAGRVIPVQSTSVEAVTESEPLSPAIAAAALKLGVVLIEQGRLTETLKARYPDTHAVRSDSALYDYVMALKQRHLRNGAPINKVLYDSSLGLTARALGTHTTVSRVQGTRLKSKREIRVASLFKEAPAAFLRMIVVHELAHLKEREHDKAFYKLCTYMEPQYHQYEFDLRLWLVWRDLQVQSVGL